jgi:hypothetical protein
VRVPGVGAEAAPLELPLPRTAAELQGLRSRREILRDQLSRASNRRDEVVRALRESEPDERAGLQERLRAIDERILQLERDQAATERQLSNAAPEVLAAAAQRSDADTVDTMPEGAAISLMGVSFGLGVLGTLAVGRVRRRRRGPASAPAAHPAALPDPRLEQLSRAVDAIAVEVERIGEGQRFVTQLLADAPARTREVAPPRAMTP